MFMGALRVVDREKTSSKVSSEEDSMEGSQLSEEESENESIDFNEKNLLK